MKRILAACVLLLAGLSVGALVSAQVNGAGGVYINGVLQGGAGAGTVTSVGLSLPAFMNVSGTNPITSSGTFTLGLANVSSTLAFLGPASGDPDAPAFRAIATTDLANPDAAGVLTSDGAGALSWETPAATGANTALSNLASVAVNANIVPASNHATDLGTSALAWKTVYSADVKTDSGRLLGLTATAPAAAVSTTAGVGVNLTASAATAGTTNAGAAAGGNVLITAGAAAQKTSGDANGGNIILVPGAGVGTGTSGVVCVPDGVWGAPAIQIGTGALGFYKIDAETIRMAAPNAPMLQSFFFGCTTYNRLSYSQGLQLPGDTVTSQVSWGPNGFYGSDDTGVARGGVGILKITNGSTGYGGIELDANARQWADAVALSDNAKTAVLDIAIADGEFIGGTLTYTITSTDATDHQALTGIVGFSGVRKNGTPDTYHLTIAESATPVLAESSGASTLTDTWAIDAGTNIATISVTADSSLTTPTMTVRYQLTLNSANAVTKK